MVRARERNGNILDMALVEGIVARMVQRHDHEACIGQRGRRVVMAEEPSAKSMRDNDERELVAEERAIHDASERDAVQRQLLRRCGARRPNRGRDRAFSVSGDFDELQARSLGQRGGKAECGREHEANLAHASIFLSLPLNQREGGAEGAGGVRLGSREGAAL